MRRIYFKLPVVAFAVLASPSPGFAQAAAPVARPPADDIVISADKATAGSSIDRKTYSIARDLQSVTGSASDVLDKLPSVDIDAQGGVSLRGNPNIQVLIDGKPSTAASGSNRGEYLQTIPASSIESIEVITNPSARFKPDGSAGLINIILKKNRRPGSSGTATANVGSDGRFNLGVAPALRRGALGIDASFNLKRDRPYRPFGTRRTQRDAATGALTDSRQDGLIRSRRLSEIAAVTVDYDLTAADRVTGGYDYNRRTGSIDFTEANRIVGPVGTITDFDRDGTGSERRIDREATARYRHSFAGKGHELTVDLRRGETSERQSRRFVNSYRVPAGLATGDRQQPRSDEVQREATIEYSRPLDGGGKLLLGYDFQRDDDDYDNRADTIDAASDAITPDPSLTNRFVYGQSVHAAYGTVERPLGAKLTALIGLRGEVTRTDARQVTTGERSRDRYTRVYPTLHLDYALSDARTLRLSYSHRIVRPEAEDLNPYPLFQNPLNLRAGNPALRPEETDSVEASYEFASNGAAFSVSPYLRDSTNIFNEFSRLISPTVLLTTQANIGRSLAAGSEFAASGKLGRSLSWSVSGNFYYSSMNTRNLGIRETRSAVIASGKASLDYKLGPRDLLQVSATAAGDRLIPQGRRRSAPSANFGFRHVLRPDLAVVLTVTDVFDSARDRVTIDTGTLRDVATFRRARRAATVALSWTFGEAKTPAPKFDYSVN